MSVNATFFLSSTVDKCIYNGASIDANDLTANGNLCAYVEGVNRVWACSAPDRVCWTYSQTCKGGDSTTPDDSQIACSSNGDEWCCTENDECTRTPGQINICWGLWRNPVFNMSSSEALVYNQEHYSTLASTTTSAAASTSTSPPATNAAEASSAASASASTTASASASSQATAEAGSSSLSTGAVAGIAVGCAVGGIALAGLAGLLIWRRRKRSGSGATPQWANDQSAVEPKQSGSEPLSHELHTDNQLHEADGSPVYFQQQQGGTPPKSSGTHELPGQRYP
ncbi:hypothetical protein BFW01_g8361 [Lasiodiplodia theobromae]|uniref:Carcinoembryonic antigen-related cell adhesion molecule 1 n=1 Tax=Lasiodiplodia theobromae TaxID=45133 RepID=A0A5N5DA80_9PEZI|nr:hypothetical protein DBV05_g6610 [Lasiodiplodia theobromae]KAF9637465.1 hypothetical protein BFW01_g8361 [Lasiodiplodia theobromae]